MKKLIIQGLITIVLFFATWLLLQQIDWINVLKVEKVTDKTEEKLGDLFWETFKKTEIENKETLVVNAVDSLVIKICESNDIDREKIKLHILTKDEINAFALPNGHLVVYSGLIVAAENQEELAGVLGHEIAHIELNHVMKKLVKEIGLSALISMSTGGNGTEVIRAAAKTLSSSAFDRSLEKDADIKAVEYLVASDLNPEPFGEFLYKLADNEGEVPKYLTWISTHPDSKERAEYIIEYSKKSSVKNIPVLKEDTWNALKETLEFTEME